MNTYSLAAITVTPLNPTEGIVDDFITWLAEEFKAGPSARIGEDSFDVFLHREELEQLVANYCQYAGIEPGSEKAALWEWVMRLPWEVTEWFSDVDHKTYQSRAIELRFQD